MIQIMEEIFEKYLFQATSRRTTRTKMWMWFLEEEAYVTRLVAKVCIKYSRKDTFY